MNLKKRKLDSYTAIDVTGALSDSNTTKFKNEIISTINGGDKNLILNLEEVSTISSQAIGVIITVWKKTVKENGCLYIITGNKKIDSILCNTNLKAVISIFSTEEDFRNEVLKKEYIETRPKIKRKGKYRILETADSFGVYIEAEHLDKALNSMLELNSTYIAINMTDIVHIDSITIGIIVKYYKILDKINGELCIFGLNKNMSYYLELIGLNKIIKILPNEESIE